MSRHASSSIAGLATLSSPVLLVATIAMAWASSPAGLGWLGAAPIGGVSLLAAILLAAVGLAGIAAVGPGPLAGRAIRTALGVLSGGLGLIGVSSLLAMRLASDPLEDWPSVVALLAGIVGLGLGVPLTIAVFLASPGVPRRLALLFLGGSVLVLIGGNIALNLFANGALRGSAQALVAAGIGAVIAGGACMLGAFGGIGWLALSRDHPAPAPAA